MAGKTAGIICEYNPFHYGHAWHIAQTRRQGYDRIICVMSGNFVQRGEPAILQKYARAACAVQQGADLVLELPFPFACASAETFAMGALGILSASGVTDGLSFGSEEGTLSRLEAVAHILAEEPLPYRQKLKTFLDSGLSYATSRQAALRETTPALAEVLDHPNNLLGIAYLMAAIRTRSPLTMMTIPRIGAGYADTSLESRYASATAIRQLMMTRAPSLSADPADAAGQALTPTHVLTHAQTQILLEALTAHMPVECARIASREIMTGRGPVSLQAFAPIMLAVLRKMTPEEISRLPDVSEGLENRIHKAALTASTLEEWLTLAGSTRYTGARLRRILCYALTGLKRTEQQEYLAMAPDCSRVLAFNDHGRELISRMTASGHSMVTGSLAAEIYHIRGSLASGTQKSGKTAIRLACFQLETLASDLYVLGYPDFRQRKAGMDKKPAVYVKSP